MLGVLSWVTDAAAIVAGIGALSILFMMFVGR